jgi:hypothetical protein
LAAQRKVSSILGDVVCDLGSAIGQLNARTLVKVNPIAFLRYRDYLTRSCMKYQFSLGSKIFYR